MVRHPWYPILIWSAVLCLAIPAAVNIGSVISSSFGNVIPSSDESVVAQNELSTEFPNSTSAPSSALILLEGPQLSGSMGRNATLALVSALATDPKLTDVQSVTSVYQAYAGYLTGQAELGLGFLDPALASTPSLPSTVNQTASVLWSPAQEYALNWETEVRELPAGAPPSAANWPAYNLTRVEVASDPDAVEILAAFYNGNATTGAGFNATVSASCLESLNVTPCVDASVRSTLPPLLSQIFPSPANRSAAAFALTGLGLENLSCWGCVQRTASALLGAEVGLNAAWVLTLWQTFPSPESPSKAEVAGWAESVATGAVPPGFVPPLPGALRASFVSSSGSATLVIVAFRVSDTYVANGSSVTFADDAEIAHVASEVFSSSGAYRSISYYVTGGSPIDSAASYLATSALGILLVLTIVVLIVIMIIYFRAPAAPLVTFGVIGISIAASLGIVYLLGRFVTSFNPEVEPVLLVFLMSIGTDYTVFLMARYREELVKGASSPDAVHTTTRWAGQSITTSGLTVAIVTTAMIFGGIGPMVQFGWALTFGVLTTLLVALTVVPSILRLVGPRIFWPNTGNRFREYARRRSATAESGYIARAGQTATRRPWLVIGIVLLLSAPIGVVAFEVPVSYDITNIGLPPSNPAQQGLVALDRDFGSGYTSPSFVLATFEAPVVAGGRVNLTEFGDIAAIASVINRTSGIASVGSLVGGSGPPLGYWANFSSLPPAQHAMAMEEIGSYVGVDGRTVDFEVTTDASGYSAAAISEFQGAENGIASLRATHPEIVSVHYGGAAQTTSDLRELVTQTNEGMLIGAAVGLFVVLLVILGSAFVPALALGAIGLSIIWSWAGTYLVVGLVESESLIFLLPLILLILILGLGMDYNVLLLTRVREEREKGGRPVDAVRRAVTNAGGVIAAAAVILGGAFLLLGLTSPLAMLAAIGLGIGIAVLLQAFVVQTYLTPAVLTLGRDRIWRGWARPRDPSEPPPE